MGCFHGIWTEYFYGIHGMFSWNAFMEFLNGISEWNSYGELNTEQWKTVLAAASWEFSMGNPSNMMGKHVGYINGQVRYDGILWMEISTATPRFLSTDRENAVKWLRLVDSSCLMWVKFSTFLSNSRISPTTIGISQVSLGFNQHSLMFEELSDL